MGKAFVRQEFRLPSNPSRVRKKPVVKQTKYAGLAEAAGLDFRPCVFDTHGACDPQGMTLLRFIARAWGNRFDIVPSRAVPLVIQRVSATLMRGIAQLLLANVAGT